MKIRDFVVALKCWEDAKINITIPIKDSENIKIDMQINLADYFSKNYCAINDEELQDYFLESGYEIVGNKYYKKCQKALNDGFFIVLGEFSNEKGTIEYLLYKRGLKRFIKKNNNIRIVYD